MDHHTDFPSPNGGKSSDKFLARSSILCPRLEGPRQEHSETFRGPSITASWVPTWRKFYFYWSRSFFPGWSRVLGGAIEGFCWGWARRAGAVEGRRVWSDKWPIKEVPERGQGEAVRRQAADAMPDRRNWPLTPRILMPGIMGDAPHTHPRSSQSVSRR